MVYLLGYDIGSSAIKASVIDADTGKLVASASSPQTELDIIARKPGWAEQDPMIWWEHVKNATAKLKSSVNLLDIKAIGISYQMHGLVLVDNNRRVLAPSIIWCDSRAVEIGDTASDAVGREYCLERVLNLPGNFTASKLAWVKHFEPDIYKKTYKMMLPGDFIAMMLTGVIKTTRSGLSEGIFWDYRTGCVSGDILNHFGFDPEILPDIVPTFGLQGEVTREVCDGLGFTQGTTVSYRSGDQPNNAFSLNVLNPGEVAATAGTSGVIYGVTDKAKCDPLSRVNIFIHVNHTENAPRYGILLCVNGTGILNRWIKDKLFGKNEAINYTDMNEIASRAPIGSDGLVFIPYGNGAERTLENRDIGASVHNLNFNVHDRSHFLRAAQEGIVFALKYGSEIMSDMGAEIKSVRAGNANMFLSPIFCEAFANTLGVSVELYDTDGAQGAARGAGVGSGAFANPDDAFVGLDRISVFVPDDKLIGKYNKAYENWRDVLSSLLNER